MSGYDPERNIFELTATKMSYWFRRKDFPPGVVEHCECCGHQLTPPDQVVVRLLEHFGLKVLKDGGNYLVVRGSPEEIWEALSGQPSDPQRAQHYYRGGVDLSKYDGD
jgi:hypothetical protein